MPTYDYLCQKYGTPFEVRTSFDQYDSQNPPKCPHCGSVNVIRVFSPGNVWISGRRRGGAGGGCLPSAGPGCCG